MWHHLAVDALHAPESYDCSSTVFISSRLNIHSRVRTVTCWHLMLTAELPCAQGYGIPLQYRGSVNNASTGAHRANLSPAVKTLGVEIATDELHHVAFLRTALGASAPDKPAVCVCVCVRACVCVCVLFLSLMCSGHCIYEQLS